MSLLQEILSSIKRESSSVEVPPNLRRIVSASVTKQRTRKRAIIISLFALFMVGTGFGAIRFFESVPNQIRKSGEGRKVLQVLHGLQTQPVLTMSDQGPAAITAPPSPPPPPREPVKESAPPRESGTTGSLRAHAQPGTGPSEDGARVWRSTGLHSGQAVNISDAGAAETVGKMEKDLHLYMAKSFESVGDLGKAVAQYKKALESDPENHVVLNNMAGILIRLGLHSEAGAYAERALASRKDYVPSLVNLAVARLKLGETKEGMKHLSRALQLAPADKATLSNLALLYEKAGEYGKAYDLYGRLAAMDDVDGHLGMARVCEKESRGKEAEAIYRNILKRDLDKKVKKLANERLAVLGSGPDGGAP